MRYISWAAFYEGPSDALYLDVLLPRIVRDLIAAEGTTLADVPDAPAVKLGRNGREVAKVAHELCGFKEALDLVFIHADTGGRGLQRHLASRSDSYCAKAWRFCEWPLDRCVTITPRHETEAWLLADGEAITKALGFKGKPASVGLPLNASAAEQLPDPKDVLGAAVAMIAGRRRGQRIETLFPAIAQRQRMASLRESQSFVDFESRLRHCLRALHYLG